MWCWWSLWGACMSRSCINKIRLVLLAPRASLSKGGPGPCRAGPRRAANGPSRAVPGRALRAGAGGLVRRRGSRLPRSEGKEGGEGRKGREGRGWLRRAQHGCQGKAPRAGGRGRGCAGSPPLLGTEPARAAGKGSGEPGSGGRPPGARLRLRAGWRRGRPRAAPQRPRSGGGARPGAARPLASGALQLLPAALPPVPPLPPAPGGRVPPG